MVSRRRALRGDGTRRVTESRRRVERAASARFCADATGGARTLAGVHGDHRRNGRGQERAVLRRCASRSGVRPTRRWCGRGPSGLRWRQCSTCATARSRSRLDSVAGVAARPDALEQLDVPFDGELVLRRWLALGDSGGRRLSGRLSGRLRINDRTATLETVRGLAPWLADIHGQREHLSLLAARAVSGAARPSLPGSLGRVTSSRGWCGGCTRSIVDWTRLRAMSGSARVGWRCCGMRRRRSPRRVCGSARRRNCGPSTRDWCTRRG